MTIRFVNYIVFFVTTARAITAIYLALDHLLSAAHPNGRHKAKFFTGFGFFAADWQLLANALVEHAVEHGVANVEPSPFGIRYVIEGKVVSPDLRNPLIRAVWFIETNSNIPYFVTAYPMEGKTL